MRVNKVSGTQSMTYAYDGQMPVEGSLVDTANHANDTTTRYALGARGPDRIETGSSVTYPIYDSHGNVLTTLARSGSGYSYATCRLYNAWGGIRSGAPTGTPNARHCANLGHLTDDESGLVYMRARCYDPGSGRFVTEDSARSGLNWFAYSEGDPISKADASGQSATFYMGLQLGFMQALVETIHDMWPNLTAHTLMMAVYDAASSVAVGALAAMALDWLSKWSVLKDTLKSPTKVGLATFAGALGALTMLEMGKYVGRLYWELFAMDCDDFLDNFNLHPDLEGAREGGYLNWA